MYLDAMNYLIIQDLLLIVIYFLFMYSRVHISWNKALFQDSEETIHSAEKKGT